MQTRILDESVLDNNIVRNAYSILMGNLYLTEGGKNYKTLTITSCNPREGKTSLATGLAITMAKMGHSTLLADFDLRKCNGAGDNDCGISDYLKGQKEMKDVLYSTNIENLSHLSFENLMENPMSFLCSEKLDLLIQDMRNEFDYVVFDTPALECVNDAVIISVKTDATILAAQMGSTTIVDIKKAQDQFNKVNANLIGVILNKVGKRKYKRKLSAFNYFAKKRKAANCKNNTGKTEIAHLKGLI